MIKSNSYYRDENDQIVYARHVYDFSHKVVAWSYVKREFSDVDGDFEGFVVHRDFEETLDRKWSYMPGVDRLTARKMCASETFVAGTFFKFQESDEEVYRMTVVNDPLLTYSSMDDLAAVTVLNLNHEPTVDRLLKSIIVPDPKIVEYKKVMKRIPEGSFFESKQGGLYKLVKYEEDGLSFSIENFAGYTEKMRFGTSAHNQFISTSMPRPDVKEFIRNEQLEKEFPYGTTLVDDNGNIFKVTLDRDLRVNLINEAGGFEVSNYFYDPKKLENLKSKYKRFEESEPPTWQFEVGQVYRLPDFNIIRISKVENGKVAYRHVVPAPGCPKYRTLFEETTSWALIEFPKFMNFHYLKAGFYETDSKGFVYIHQETDNNIVCVNSNKENIDLTKIKSLNYCEFMQRFPGTPDLVSGEHFIDNNGNLVRILRSSTHFADIISNNGISRNMNIKDTFLWKKSRITRLADNVFSRSFAKNCFYKTPDDVLIEVVEIDHFDETRYLGYRTKKNGPVNYMSMIDAVVLTTQKPLTEFPRRSVWVSVIAGILPESA